MIAASFLLVFERAVVIARAASSSVIASAVGSLWNELNAALRMNDICERTIQWLGSRSSNWIMGVTVAFAMVGSLWPMFLGTGDVPVVWIPMCFMVIPAVHFLGRELLSQRRRIAELEKRLVELS